MAFFFSSTTFNYLQQPQNYIKMANSTQKPYQYFPITGGDCIRLIVLHPSPDEAAGVECEIIHTTLR
jgi:hypothetical protein